MWYSHYEFTCLKIPTFLKYGCTHTDNKIRNPSTLHFHGFLVRKTVAYIEKTTCNSWFGFFLVNLLWFIGFLSLFSLSLWGEGKTHANRDCTFCLCREYLGALGSLLARVGWKSQSLLCWDADVQDSVWGMCWLRSTCIKSLPWADALRICFVTKILICLNSLSC